jgi:hypothetical protein
MVMTLWALAWTLDGNAGPMAAASVSTWCPSALVTFSAAMRLAFEVASAVAIGLVTDGAALFATASAAKIPWAA